jgi:enoyl-CoA hydratase/carnithine racemase
MSAVLIEKRDDGVYWLTINRADARNAMNVAVIGGLTEAFLEIIDDPNARAVILTGAGDRVFCAGGDIKAGAADKDSPYKFKAGSDHPFVKLQRITQQVPVPIIARVNGHAMGGGLGLVCMVDLAVASRNAKFGSPEAKIGIFPLMILAHMLRLIPIRKLYEMALTGRAWSAEEALRDNIINHLVDKVEELDDGVDTLLQPILKGAPTAIRVGKKAMQTLEFMDFNQRLDHAQLIIDKLSQTEDAKEGLSAFLEKRAPDWTGN